MLVVGVSLSLTLILCTLAGTFRLQSDILLAAGILSIHSTDFITSILDSQFVQVSFTHGQETTLKSSTCVR